MTTVESGAHDVAGAKVDAPARWRHAASAVLHPPRYRQDCHCLARLRLDHGGRAAGRCGREVQVAKPEGFPNADLYQRLAYCTVLGLRDGHLVYAAGSGVDAAVHDIRGTDVRIHVHTLDLDVSKESLLAQVGEIAARIEECGRVEALSG